IARERDVEARQRALLERTQPLDLIQKIVTERAVAVDQPVAAARAVELALLEERAIRGDARAGADHHDRGRTAFRQPEAVVRLDVDARFRWSRADVRGGRAPMRKAETLVLHERHA